MGVPDPKEPERYCLQRLGLRSVLVDHACPATNRRAEVYVGAYHACPACRHVLRSDKIVTLVEEEEGDPLMHRQKHIVRLGITESTVSAAPAIYSNICVEACLQVPCIDVHTTHYHNSITIIDNAFEN